MRPLCTSYRTTNKVYKYKQFRQSKMVSADVCVMQRSIQFGFYRSKQNVLKMCVRLARRTSCEALRVLPRFHLELREEHAVLADHLVDPRLDLRTRSTPGLMRKH